MQQDTEKTKVVFRKFPDGQVIAMFYEEIDDLWPRNCWSYMHIGQHGAASLDLVYETDLATPAICVRDYLISSVR